MKLLNEIPTMANWINKTHPVKFPRHRPKVLARKDKKRLNDLASELYYIHLKEKSIIPHYIAFVNNDWKKSQLFLKINNNKGLYEIQHRTDDLPPNYGNDGKKI